MFDITKITAFVHRTALQLIAIAAAVGVGVSQYGPGIGLSGDQIALIAAGAVSFVTVTRSVADVTEKKTAVQDEMIAKLTAALSVAPGTVGATSNVATPAPAPAA